LLRWRLALGPEAERAGPHLDLAALAAEAEALGLAADEPAELERALEVVYGEGGAPRGAGLGGSAPWLPRWLGAVRRLFSHDVVSLVQQDAIARRGLSALLLEPEALACLEPNVELVATLVAARGLIPDRAKEAARRIIREVVDDLRRRLESELRTAVLGALRRDRRSPLRSLRNLDWRRTLRESLRGWDAERRRLVPERLHFWANQRRRHERDVVLLVDQSGSMAESVVWAAVMAAIFASLDVLRTRLVLFDTEVVDMTPALQDPVEVLFSVQLGGGTDIHRAVAWAQERVVERPERTLLVLVSDLCEGGDREGLVARLKQLVDARVRAVCLLALTDSGRPAHDHDLAARLSAVGVPCFGCTPRLLPEVMERLLAGQDPVAPPPGRGAR
jgi:Mg-chelatase subunit ChlD